MNALVLPSDPQQREWLREFEWHLDTVPPIMDTLTTLALPQIRASRTDKVLVSGGGYVDNVPGSFDVTRDGYIVDVGAGRDAADLWAWVVAYTRAAAEWVQQPSRPAPALADKPNPDPLSARAVALLTIGWLIDHAGQIQAVGELDAHRAEMFALIRRLRGRYGVHRHPRRTRPARCGVCGECAVVVDWLDAPNGSPKPIQVGRCKVCGQVYTEETP